MITAVLFGVGYRRFNSIYHFTAETAAKKDTPKEVNVRFKASPLFTDFRKQMITNEVHAFHQYLVKIGFEPPNEFPPLEVIHGDRRIAMNVIFCPPNPLTGTISTTDGNIDKAEFIVKVYSSSIFARLFDTCGKDADEIDFNNGRAYIFSDYYTSSFTNALHISGSAYGNWSKALWEIREKYGQSFTDNAMFYTYKIAPPRRPNERDFAQVFSNQFRHGMSQVDNNFENRYGVQKVLQSHGLSANNW